MEQKTIMRSLARNASRSTLGNALDSLRIGWSSYSFLLYIGSAAAILGGFFGFAGWISVVLTVVLFYYAGEFKKHVNIESKKFGAPR